MTIVRKMPQLPVCIGKRAYMSAVCLGALSVGLAAPAIAAPQAQPVTAPPASPAIPAARETAPTPNADTPDTDTVAGENVVVVTGIRANLDSAQNRKRNADTVIDSITAKDMGSFPDKSVAEAVQRIAGVTVNRFSGTDDTSHFSAEPSGVIVRGLPQVRSELNGRDIFSANSSRGLSWEDIAPDLLGGVDVYKNQTADLIEGGIAGTVNLRTRLPFDSKTDMLSIGVTANYGSIAKSVTPELSLTGSKRWTTSAGEFGAMLNLAYSNLKTASQGIQFDRIAIFAPDTFIKGAKAYVPSGVFMRDNIYDRKRYGIAGALQWRSNDGSMEAALQYTRSQYKNSWREHSVYSSAGNALGLYGRPTDYIATEGDLIQPAPGTAPFTFDRQGNMTSGWWRSRFVEVGDETTNPTYGQNQAGAAFYNYCGTDLACIAAGRAPQIDTSANALRNDQYTQDFGLSFKWKLSDRTRFSMDGQYVDAKLHNYNASVTARTYAETYFDATGKYPKLSFRPDQAANINLSPGGIANAANYHYFSVTDHSEDSDGKEFALRADLEQDIDNGWLKSVKIGGRYSDRDQTVRWGAYNWASISNGWTPGQAPYFNIDKPVYPAGTHESFDFGSGFFNGNQLSQREFLFFSMKNLESREKLAAALGRPAIGVGDYYPICSNAGYRAGETTKGKFGCYLPGEILKTSESTLAGYAMARFGGDALRIGSIGLSGNIGARFVGTTNKTRGAITYPTPFQPEDLLCPPGSVTAGCVTSPAEQAFSSGGSQISTVSKRHFNVLPSANLRIDWTDKLLSRIAYSRAMSRPDIGLMRNYITITRLSPALNDPTNPDIIYGPDGKTITGYKWRYTAQAGNPALRPIEADQFDATLEYYFANAGSVTATAFYKKFNNYIALGRYNLAVTNNGVTRDVLVQAPMNVKGAAIKGAELAFQTFFDFLPGALKGLGVQANYTYVMNDGIVNANLTNETPGSTSGGGVSVDQTAVTAKALEGISKHSYNIVGMYERGPVSARIAYNWRSKFLVSALDCCVGLPIWQKGNGYLDASLNWKMTPALELRVQASNLLGTDTVLLQQVDNDGPLRPNAWFKNDRRYQVGLRWSL